MTIGLDETRVNEMTCCMGSEVIRVSVMWFGVRACIDETFWMGGKGTLYVMIFFSISEVIFSTEGALFDSISLFSSASGSQKNESSDMLFGRGDTGKVETFVGEAIRSDLTC